MVTLFVKNNIKYTIYNIQKKTERKICCESRDIDENKIVQPTRRNVRYFPSANGRMTSISVCL